MAMRRYKLTLTRRDITKRLAAYPPRLLYELTLILDNFEINHDLIDFNETPEQKDAIRNELFTAYYKEKGATKQEIVALLKRMGLN
jgi:hypothetical protein